MSSFLSLVFLFHLIGNAFTFPEVCNPIECFALIDAFFKPCPSKEYCSCEKIINLEKCVRNCVSNKTDNFVLQGLHEVNQDLCHSFQDYDLENKCSNKHKFRLMSCIYEKFHLEVEDPHVNKNLLMCRQALDGQYCDRESLSLCSDRQTYLSEVFLVKFFKPLQDRSCVSFSRFDVDQLNLKPLAKDYNNLAECLDVNSPYVTDCVPQKWISTNVSDKHMLCSAVQSFLNCVEKIVESKCNKQKSVYTIVRWALFSYLLPHCSTQQSSALSLDAPDMSDNNSNEVYSAETATNSQTNTEAVTTESPQNSSEVVVVHQHVVITVNYRAKNAANLMHVCHYLIVMVFLLIVAKVVS